MAQVRQDNVQIKLEIDGSQSKTELDNLTRRALVLQQGLKEMKRGTDEYIAANKELREVNARIAELRDEIGITGLSTGQLTKLMKQLNRELVDLVPGTAAYIAESEELVKVENRIAEVKSGLDAVRASLSQSGSSFSDFLKKAVGFAGIQLGVEAVVGSLKQLGTESINSALKSSDAISDMEKSLNLTTAEAKALRTQLEGIDTRTSEEKLEGIAIAAGQLGIGKDEVVAFTTSVDQAVVALGDEFTGGVEEVTKSLGGLQKLFKDTANVSPADAITKIGSAINALGADGTATGPVIADFAARIGQLGDLAPQISQTLGLGAAFQELGLSAEISAGGLTTILLTASKDTAGFGKQIGLTSKEFERLINTDPNEVILRLAASLKGASNTEITATLDALNIKSQEATKVISLLANQTDTVRDKQALASAEYAKGTSLLDEYLKKNTNAAAEVEKAEKAFAQGRRELGERLIPIYILALQTIGFFIGVIKALPGFLHENRAALAGLAVAVLTLNAEQIKLTATTLYNTAVTKGKILWDEAATFATTKYTTAQRLLNTAFKDNPVGLFIAVVALLVGAFVTLYERSEKVRLVMAGLSAAFGQMAKNLKEAVLLNLGGLADLLTGIFTFDAEKIKAGLLKLGESVKKTYTGLGDGVAGAYAQGYGEREQLEHAKQEKKAEAQHQQQVQLAKKRAKEKAAAAAAADLEALKTHEANIRAALALVEAGSAEELRLKKLLVVTKRDIDLLGEKKTEGDKKVIRAEALRDLRQLQDDYDKKTKDAAEKRAKEQADVEKRIADLKAGLLTDEAEKRIQQLTAAAEKEKTTAKGTAEQIAEQRRLIDEKLAVDVLEVRRQATVKAGLAELEVEKLNSSLIKNQFDRKNTEIDIATREAKLKLLATDKDYAVKVKAIDDKALADHKVNEDERVNYHQQVLDKITAMEEETAQLTRARKLRQAGVTEQDRKDADAEDLADKIGKLNKEEQAEQDSLVQQLEQGLITTEEFEQAQSELFANFRAKRKDANDKMADDEISRWKADVDEKLGYASQGIRIVADLFKVSSDNQLKKEEADKKKRLASLEAEYKAGRISKDAYEAAKAEIESNYDAKTRQIKKEAAEKEKVAKIAQAVIQTAVNVVEAFPNPYLMAAAAALGAFQIGTIVATPIPEFEKGGIWGRAGRAVKQTAGQAWQGVKEYATGGRINPTAGVAGVGQRHSGGGIRMVDGATGEHLGEWEKGEAYMILSRDTYANNKHLVDELIDTSLHRGGAPVRQQQGYYADGGTFGATPTPPATTSGRAADNQELVQLLRETRDAIRALPNRQHIAWDQDDTAELEQRLDERAEDRAAGQVK